MQLHNDTYLQSWVGGRSFKSARAHSPLFQNGKGQQFCTRVKDDPPTHHSAQVCDTHTAALRSIPRDVECAVMLYDATLRTRLERDNKPSTDVSNTRRDGILTRRVEL